MGNLEKLTTRSRKKENLQRAILATVASAGVLSIALVAPNLMKVLRTPLARSAMSNFKRSQNRLIENGLLSSVSKNGKQYLSVTDKGFRKLRELGINAFGLTKSKKWDGKWRIVTFDIWESRRNARKKLRNMLRNIGFLKLQQSLWVYPYDCEDFINLVKVDLKLGIGTIYIIADHIEGDYKLRKHFGLEENR